jgi:hypothetical protein
MAKKRHRLKNSQEVRPVFSGRPIRLRRLLRKKQRQNNAYVAGLGLLGGSLYFIKDM